MSCASPFAYMASTLANQAVLQLAQAQQRPAGLSRTDAMRELLRQGPQRADALGRAGGVASVLVMPLLKNDLASGRVRRTKVDGRNVYELAADFDPDLQHRLREAERLLRRHGYDVTAPGAQGEQA